MTGRAYLFAFKFSCVRIDCRIDCSMMFTDRDGSRVAKGLRRIAKERGVPDAQAEAMTKEQLVVLANTQWDDFKLQRCKIQEVFEDASPSYHVIFLPKFHCSTWSLLSMQCQWSR